MNGIEKGAEALVHELIAATTEYTKAVNSSRGHKGAAKREWKAARAVLEALLGKPATAEQVDRVCDY